MRNPSAVLLALAAAMSSGWAFTEIPVVRSLVPTGTGTHQKIAYGVYVKVGSGDQAQARLFQLDSGNGSFLAGYASGTSNQFWGSVSQVDLGSYHAGFGSGVSMNFHVVQGQVMLSDENGGDLFKIVSMDLGQVYSASGGGLVEGEWREDLENGQPPLHKTYYGNFGVDTYSTTATNLNSSGCPANVSLFSALGQVENVVGVAMLLSGATPTIRIVYDSDAEYIATFTATSTMVSGTGTKFPVTGYETTNEHQIGTSLSINGITSGTTNGLFDSGGEAVTLPASMTEELTAAGLVDANGNVIAGQTLTMTLTDGVTLTMVTGTTDGVDLVSTGTKEVDLNFGPAMYNYYDVFFDFSNGKVAFSSVVPEPGPVGLTVFGALAVAWSVRRKMRGG